jgi:hypothetical protein
VGRVITLRLPDKANQRSQRSERSGDGQDIEMGQKERNAQERSEGFGNAVSVDERSANPLIGKGWNAGNAGNADFPYLSAEGVSNGDAGNAPDADDADEVIL